MNDQTSIECRAAVELQPLNNNEILFLPVGIHPITPVSGGIGRPINIKVTSDSARAVEQQRVALMAKGKRPYFDFNHEDGPASFWPETFVWRDNEGVIAKGEWSQKGKRAVEGKEFRAFSPVFHVDNKRAEAALVVCRETAEPNMGGLVNNPAFKNLPLWAKNAGASGDSVNQKQTNGENEMKQEEIDALRSSHEELKSEVDRLKSLASEDDSAKTRLTAAESELRAVHAEIEAAELRAENDRQSTLIRARNKTEAENAVKAAIQRGAVLPKDKATQTDLIARATADPSFLSVINAMQGKMIDLATRITGAVQRGVQVTAEAPAAIFASMARILGQSKKISGFNAVKLLEKLDLARQFNAIYAAEFRGDNRERLYAFPVSELENALVAADVTDTDWGTLAGTLVTQKTLELLKFMFPPLTAFTTDFSSEGSTFNQTVMTRTVGIPAVSSYNTSTGWSDATPDTNDVPVTIDAHRGVQIGINENVIASTVRRLFDELAPAQAYALGKDMVDALYTRITDANFPNNSVVATASFTRSSVIDLATALNLLGVPIGPNMRSLLLYSTVFGQLQKDSAIISLAAFQRPELITGQQQVGAEYAINVSSFRVFDAPNLPTNDGNVTGFAGSKSALVIATRVPNDYASVFPGATGGGVVQIVTDPDIGISVMLVQYIDHKLGKASQRIALMYGTAAGQSNAGMLLKAHTGSGSSRTS